MDTNILEKKNCLITGATGGLGKQIAIELAKKNCNLFLTSMEGNFSAYGPVITTISLTPIFFKIEIWRDKIV